MNYTPESSQRYKGNQIIITANRLTFIGKKDSVLISANKAISLSALTSVNIDTSGPFIVNATRISLGLGATEPLIKGAYFTNRIVNGILKILTALSGGLSDSVNGPMNTPNIGLAMTGVEIGILIEQIKKELPASLSTLSFTN